jgi:competence CoiA-like predicted nuclease
VLLDALRERANPQKRRSTCPDCDGVLIAKCGEIKIWHWAHRSGIQCDPWAEPETAWHLGWKLWLMEHRHARIEVRMAGGKHRADAVMLNGDVVELQHSPIDPATIREREEFYRHMVWLYNATGHRWWSRCEFFAKEKFWWKHGAPSLCAHNSPVWWDGTQSLSCVRIFMRGNRVHGERRALIPKAQWLPHSGRWPPILREERDFLDAPPAPP